MGNVAQTVERAHDQIGRSLRERRYKKLLMVGNSSGGKTSILKKFRKPRCTERCVDDSCCAQQRCTRCASQDDDGNVDAFHVEHISHQDLHFVVWEICGDVMYRLLWRRFCPNTKVIIYVVDSSCEDEDMLDYSRQDLASILEEEELSGVPLLLLCNKQDVKGARTPTQITERLGLNHMMDDRTRTAIGCSAMDGTGLRESLEWIEHAVRHTRPTPTKHAPDSKQDETISLASTANDSLLSDDSFMNEEESDRRSSVVSTSLQ